MLEFRYLYGAIYIFENPSARRVKIGMTMNDIMARLDTVNDIWLERKVTCQICGGRRLVDIGGHIPKHVVSGINCPGGNEHRPATVRAVANRLRDFFRYAISEKLIADDPTQGVSDQWLDAPGGFPGYQGVLRRIFREPSDYPAGLSVTS